MNNYKYTLEKLIENLIALEDHFKEEACWFNCIPKHCLALQLYLKEILSFCNDTDRTYWEQLNKTFGYWYSKVNIGNEKIYYNDIRTIRIEIMEKFYLPEFKKQIENRKKIGACCK